CARASYDYPAYW
nr:immunoglobulin heavy chain junction region [Mus musculus]